jgi:hypothetical protein
MWSSLRRPDSSHSPSCQALVVADARRELRGWEIRSEWGEVLWLVSDLHALAGSFRWMAAIDDPRYAHVRRELAPSGRKIRGARADPRL